MHVTNRRLGVGSAVGESSVFRDEDDLIQDERRSVPAVKIRASAVE